MIRVKSRVVLTSAAFIAILFIIAITSRFHFNNELNPYFKTEYENIQPVLGIHHTKGSHRFWNHVFQILAQNKIPEELRDGIKYVQPENSDVKSKDYLLARAEISPDLLDALTKSHAAVLEQLPSIFSTETYKKGTTGVVFMGGGRFSWLSYLSILALRDTGSKLPVQVVLPTLSDFEKDTKLCTTILPPLNATCVVVPDVLGPTVIHDWSFKSYQYKSLALMASTFDNIALLDSDNIVLAKPDAIFESELYKEVGMITWPDYWERTISPKFYELVGKEVSESTRVRYGRFPLHNPGETDQQVPFHDLEGAIPNLSTESGQLFIKKSTHPRTLLLSLYYNVYGPDLYYKLFSLGELGEGDKDTFVTAAEITKEPYYQVKSFIQTKGYHDNSFEGVAMGQSDPIVDYEKFLARVVNNEELKSLSMDEEIAKLKEIDLNEFQGKTPLFALHCNYPKLDPSLLMSKDGLYDKENNRMKLRMYSNFAIEKKTTDINGHTSTVKIDFELEQWTRIQNGLCNKRLKFAHFEDKDKKKICEYVKNTVNWLKETTKANNS